MLSRRQEMPFFTMPIAGRCRLQAIQHVCFTLATQVCRRQLFFFFAVFRGCYAVICRHADGDVPTTHAHVISRLFRLIWLPLSLR